MPEALARVRQELGEHAVILGTRTIEPRGLAGLAARPRVEITAAPPDLPSPAPRIRKATGPSAPVRRAMSERPPAQAAAARAAGRYETLRQRDTAGETTAPPSVAAGENPGSAAGGQAERVAACHADGLTPVCLQTSIDTTAGQPHQATGALPEHLRSVYQQLVENELANELVQRVLVTAGAYTATRNDPRRVREIFCEALEGMLPTTGPIRLGRDKPQRVALVGPPGAGKTTTIAKLAAHFRLRERCRVAIVSLDVHGLARHEIVGRFAEIIGVDLHTPGTLQAVRELLPRLDAYDLALVDTCGVGLRDRGRLVRLAAMLRAIQPTECHLVIPASMSAAAQSRAADALRGLGADRLVLTRLDETAGMGVVLNAASRLSLSVSYLTDGQRVPQDIRVAAGRSVAQAVLGGG